MDEDFELQEPFEKDCINSLLGIMVSSNQELFDSIKNGGTGIMNEVLREFFKDELAAGEALSRAKGRAEGREEGRQQGEVLKLIMQVKKKTEKGDSVEKIADDLLEDIGGIEKIYNAVKDYPENTKEQIYDFLTKK